MDLASRLDLPEGEPIRLLNTPPELVLTLPVSSTASAVLAFAYDQTDLAKCKPALEAAREGHVAWIAYPKAGRLGTNLNRDKLWDIVKDQGVRPVRQVAINDNWSALRFVPAAPAQAASGGPVATPRRPSS